MKTRIGIVGAGGVVERIHIPACALVPEVEIAGICDPHGETLAKVAARHGIGQIFASCEEMFDKVRPDAVIVATPPDTHFEVCRKALQAGAHVLCEKPFMSSLEEADRVIAIAQENNLLLRVNNQYRFMTFYSETKRRLQAGEFGKVFYIQCWQQMFHPPSTETNWRSHLKQYVLYEFGTHALDLLSFFFDALPESVSAHMPRCRPEYDADVVVQMTLRYPEERMATLSFNRVSHAPEKYLEMRLDCEQASLRISLGGVARISIEWNGKVRRPVAKWGLLKGGQARAEIDGASTTYCSSRDGEFATATACHLREFLVEMRQPLRSAEHALHARQILRLVFAGYESAASGDTVRLSRGI